RGVVFVQLTSGGAAWPGAPALLTAPCPGGAPAPRPAVRPPATPSPVAAATPLPTSSPAPAPSFYIDSLRARTPVAGSIEIGDVMWRGQGFTKSHVKWTSGGQPMTGTISMPDGNGPFPLVVVNHVHLPPDRSSSNHD